MATTGSHSDIAIMWKNYMSKIVHMDAVKSCSVEECIANTEEVNVIQILIRSI